MTGAVVLLVGIGLLNVYALSLVALRGPLFGTRVYRPMVLNIGLSVAPALVLAGTLLATLVVVIAAPSLLALILVLVLGGGAWLVLLPNAAYLVTELNFSHRRKDDDVPLWYDIVLVLTLAVSGVFNTLANVLLAQVVYVLVVHVNARDPYASADSWVIAAVVLVLVAVGIYLGRSIRFNSWDLLHLRSFVSKVVRHFRDRANRRNALGFVLTHAILLALLYLIVLAPALILLSKTS